jgi:transposase
VGRAARDRRRELSRADRLPLRSLGFLSREAVRGGCLARTGGRWPRGHRRAASYREARAQGDVYAWSASGLVESGYESLCRSECSRRRRCRGRAIRRSFAAGRSSCCARAGRSRRSLGCSRYSDASLYLWRRQDRIDRGEIAGVSSTEHAELAAARRRIAELETELAIHRRAALLLKAVVPPKGASK